MTDNDWGVTYIYDENFRLIAVVERGNVPKHEEVKNV